MKLKTKIMLLVAISVIGTLVLITYSMMDARRNLTAGHQLEIRSVTEALYTTIARLQEQEAAGKLSREQAQAAALEAAAGFRYGGADGKTEYFYIYNLEGVNLFHIKKELIGQDLREKIRDGKGGYPVKDLLAAIASQPHAFVESSFPRPGSDVAVPKLQFVMKFEPWGWMIGTGIYIDKMEKELTQRLWIDLSLAFVLLLALGGFGYVIARGVMRQVGGEPTEAIAFMNRVAAGDLSGHMPDAPRGSMLHSIGETVAALRKMVADIGRIATQLVQDADSISTVSNDVADASQRQAEATSSMAAAIEEMTVSINHISDNSRDSEENSIQSVRMAEEGVSRVETAAGRIRDIAGSVSGASDGIHKLEERAGQISSITGVIKEIAGQTNLLALNAAIEAARAGETGRGFAVVADEVRKLAERTASATLEIETMIAGIQTETVSVVGVMNDALPQVEAGVQAAEAAAASLRLIQDGTRLTLERVRDVSVSTREQSMASNSIAQKVEEIASMVETNAGAIQEAANTAKGMEKIAGTLSELVSRFRC
ncbi:methyl-accepting chemotaxis protein [Uliginosibacterium sp. 31-16]|uniref:methyl-accepting chemotaxis protein n=1 Tax=Uliginosibacterium sp. 31-16 TaxID=3068315 RepID=UPI00273EDA01|nr:methyl-accepting chemotaxis protein [Uliginosibacterium sp. 31-16]MDP5240263.1 methyl-accepting chemotaxis protein [Uliginosibacterium sp. 31-16]